MGVGLTFGPRGYGDDLCPRRRVRGALESAVTLGFYVSRRFSARQLFPYLASQCTGALLASLLLRFLFPTNQSLGGTFPAGPVWQSFVLELVLTCILMFVILSVSTGAKGTRHHRWDRSGWCHCAGSTFAGPISGASMNPARSLAPALVSGRVGALWIYLLAPIVGAILGVILCRLVRDDAFGLPNSLPKNSTNET